MNDCKEFLTIELISTFATIEMTNDCYIINTKTYVHWPKQTKPVCLTDFTCVCQIN